MNLSETDRYALARALQGLEPVEQFGLTPLTQMLVENWRGRKPDAVDIEIARKWFGQEFVAQVFAIDPNAPPPVGIDQLSFVPKLPKYASITGERPKVGRWLDDFTTWARKRASMTDELFLEAGGLWLLSMATARRAVLELDFGLIYNPLYVLWCAGTTYWRKSTGLRAVEMVARHTMPHMMLAAQATPEMLMARLAGQLPINMDKLAADIQASEIAGQAFAAQRGFISDEVSKLFAKKYMEGLPEVLMEMYDNPPRVEQEFKTQGRLVVNNPGMSLLFSTTPARLGTLFGDNEWEDGLLPRFALLSPTSQFVKRVHATRATTLHSPPGEMMKALRGLYDKLPEPEVTKAMEGFGSQTLRTEKVQIGDEALDRFNAYADAMHDFTGPTGGIDERLTGVYGRLPVMALKIAMSLTLIDWTMAGEDRMKLEIGGGHWARAQEIAEKWRASSHRLLTDLNRSSDQRIEDRIIDFLKLGHTLPPSAFEIYRGARIHRRADAFAAIEALMNDGRIMEIHTAGRKGYVLGSVGVTK